MKRLSLLSILVTTFIATPSYSSPLQGQMDHGYDLPYLWGSYAGYLNPDWMAGIDDNKSLAEISIPGTHNSLSTSGNLYSITQTLDVTEQLDMGIRYFDVRFKYEDGVLQAYHGNYKQPLTFDEFMGKISTFLYAHPTETVLIRIQNEAGASINETEFFNRFKVVSNKYNDQKIIPSSISPRLGDVRGKFIFIRDFNIYGGSIGLDRRDFFIQDIYTVQTNWDLYRKWEDIKSHFNKIKSNSGRNISLNYLSGSNIAFPYFVASGKSSEGSNDRQLWTGVSTVDKGKYPDFPRMNCLGELCSIYFSGTNQLTEKWIKEGRLPNNLGVVVADFPGGGLVDSIIQNNPPSKFLSWDSDDKSAKINDIYEYYNTFNGDTEYFKLVRLDSDGGYGYFPTDKSNNYYWTYIGPHYWSDDRRGNIGDLYVYENPYNYDVELFKLTRLDSDGRYWYLPTDKTNNKYWTYITTYK